MSWLSGRDKAEVSGVFLWGGQGKVGIKTSTYFINWGSLLVIFINHSHCTFHCRRCQFGVWCQEGREAVTVINMTDFDHEIFCPSLPAFKQRIKLNLKKTVRDYQHRLQFRT